MEDGRVALSSVSVALDGDVEGGEASLGWVTHVFGEQDGSGAGAEDGLLVYEGFEDVEEAFSVEKAEHGGGFAAGENEAV